MALNDDTFLDLSVSNDNTITADMVTESYYGNYQNYSAIEYAGIAGEVALWRAVLLQAFIDLKVKSHNKKYDHARRKAYEWFKLPKHQEDVKEVCRMSGYEYRKVQELADEIIQQQKSLRHD